VRRLAATIVLACLVSACGSHGAAKRQSATATRSAGCGVTSVGLSRLPAWTAPAFSSSGSSAPQVPWMKTAAGRAVAVVFANRLRAGQPEDPANKILWIMRLSRNGSPLSIRATPLRGRAPVVTASWPANASPGEIYPSYVNVPTAGCWHLQLRWAGHTDSIDLRFLAA
jgi:hypothetical protein